MNFILYIFLESVVFTFTQMFFSTQSFNNSPTPKGLFLSGLDVLYILAAIGKVNITKAI